MTEDVFAPSLCFASVTHISHFFIFMIPLNVLAIDQAQAN